MDECGSPIVYDWGGPIIHDWTGALIGDHQKRIN